MEKKQELLTEVKDRIWSVWNDCDTLQRELKDVMGELDEIASMPSDEGEEEANIKLEEVVAKINTVVAWLYSVATSSDIIDDLENLEVEITDTLEDLEND